MPKVNPYTKFGKPRSNASRVIARTKVLQTDGRTDGQTDGRTDGRTRVTTIPFRPKGRRVILLGSGNYGNETTRYF